VLLRVNLRIAKRLRIDHIKLNVVSTNP